MPMFIETIHNQMLNVDRIMKITLHGVVVQFEIAEEAVLSDVSEHFGSTEKAEDRYRYLKLEMNSRKILIPN